MPNQPTRKTDTALLNRLKQGEETAFEAGYWKYSAWIYNFVHALLRDKTLTEDVTQTVFLKIWEKHATIDTAENFESYLFTIARNLVYKETEKRALAEQFIESMQSRADDADTETEQTIDTESLREYVTLLVEQLPPARRQIYRLSRERHLSNKEIAGRLSLSEKTVETQLYRALRFLKQKLSDDSGLLLLLSLLLVK
jgi:RNA polymerase sigma-70 factor (ECF subfamily)